MFVIAANAELASYRAIVAAAVSSGLIEPIFAGNVVGHKLIGQESGSHELESSGAACRIAQAQSAEKVWNLSRS